jgi:AcrR family transcriptional regulator
MDILPRIGTNDNLLLGKLIRMRSQKKSVADDADRPVSRTRERLLDAAEKLFAEKGFNGVSTRMITDEADANSAAMHYHFRSKAALIRAVFERRLGPINEEREGMMAEAVAEKSPSPAKVLGAFIGPTLALGDSEGERHFKVLAAQSSLDPSVEVRNAVYDFYDSVGRHFVKSLEAACPGMPRKELFWKLGCIYGAMLYIRADSGRLQRLMGDDLSFGDPDEAMSYIIPFLTAGLASKPRACERTWSRKKTAKVEMPAKKQTPAVRKAKKAPASS